MISLAVGAARGRMARRWTAHCHHMALREPPPDAPAAEVVDCCMWATAEPPLLQRRAVSGAAVGARAAMAEPPPEQHHHIRRWKVALAKEAEAALLGTASASDMAPQAARTGDAPHESSTADCWNRFRDKARVEGELGLSEHGSPDIEFRDAADPKTVVAHGYRRVVYGDHGPYLEFRPEDVNWASLPVEVLKPPHAYYDEYYSEGGEVRLYFQKRSVEHKANPPVGGVRHNREGGYADYKVGMCYIPPDVLTVPGMLHPAGRHHANHRRWKK
mmetsp:Transcript_91407/g.263864  ORF Transcript_91407/g.263864 Transcript_91407/m.263864 type:complete len:273 (+) Transcript_91407:77-895(+)